METKNIMVALKAEKELQATVSSASSEAESDVATLSPLDEIFTVKTANEWLKESKQKPIPKMLFGEFWLEGELAILFADTGKGKSILAVHIAESVARGRAIEPMTNTARPQMVLYLDFELTPTPRRRKICQTDQAAKHGAYV
jgi:hypothetical protein